jgi:hypothetical protein
MDIDATPLFDDAVTRLIKLLKDNFKEIKTVYDGDPLAIPKANLPCIMVEKVSGTITVTDAPTSFDKFTEEIAITVAMNKLDDIGASDDIDLTERKLRRFVEGRDPNTGKYATGTLMSILRTHLTLDAYDFNGDISISYDVNARPNDIVTSEAMVTITATGQTEVGTRN